MRYGRTADFGMTASPENIRERNKKLCSRITAVIGVAGMVLFFADCAMNDTSMLLILGATFFGIGAVTMYFHRRYPDECVRPLGFMLFGIVLGVMHVIGNDVDNYDLSVPFSYGAAAGLVMIGVLLAGFPAFERAMKEKRCTLEVTARCCDINGRKLSRGGGYEYMHVWEFFIGSEMFTVPDNLWTRKGAPETGSFADIMVNPDDPQDIYRREPAYEIRLVVYGVLIALAGASVIGVMLRFGNN